jgi:hypothetical protein
LSEALNPWNGDLLNFAAYGNTFTNLIQSIDDSKVISIEAGFGHGKTFFRKAWAEHLRQAGEVVIEIDAQQSDHSGEPIVTFLGALMTAAPERERSKFAGLAAKGGKLAGVASRAVARAVLRNGAEEVIKATSDWLSGRVEGSEALEGAIKELEEGMSKLAGQMIASQLAAEHARQEELPKQIEALRDFLTESRHSKRVIILIDELDRCHPDYAIALLEAMKLVFGRPGFVFCLMVNADYLESIAHHRFGTQAAGEKYLEKFVDLRLRLQASEAVVKAATEILAKQLPLAIPFSAEEAFSVNAASELAGKLAFGSRLSFRQIKRTLEKVELALRCYRDRPVDCPLLLFLAFREISDREMWRNSGKNDLLRRTGLNPSQVEGMLKDLDNFDIHRQAEARCRKFVSDTCPELLRLPDELYGLGKAPNGGDYPDWYKVLAGLGPRYLPDHQDMLQVVHRIMA